MQERTLSSAFTFCGKFVFPLIWMAAIYISFSGLGHKNSAPPPPQMKFVFLGIWIVGTTFILWTCAGLKRVRIDDRQLYLSNYLREISVPFSEIADVRQNLWLNSKPVTIHFRNATAFGDKATFLPQWRAEFLRCTDPVVGELRQLAGLAGGRVG